MQKTSAHKFWDLYYKDAFLHLQRTQIGWEGIAYSHPEKAMPPIGLLSKPEQENIEITNEALRSFEYANDARFYRIEACRMEVSSALEAIIEGTYPYRDAPPFGKERMSGLLSQIIEKIGKDTSAMDIGDFERLVFELLEQQSDSHNQPLAALAWFLGERRQRSSTEALIALLSHASFAPFSEFKIHFTAVDTSLSALWKVNDKSRLQEILELMRYMEDSGKRKIAPLFQRLLSTNELLGFSLLEEDFYDPNYWQTKIDTVGAVSIDEWDVFDTRALYWEIRYLASLRLSSDQTDYLAILTNDVVDTVATSARSRAVN